MKRTPDDVEGLASKIEQQAAQWVARIDLHGTPEEWTALDTWLAASPRHRAAFLRLSVAWRRADELKKLAPLNGVVDADLFDPARNHAEPSEDEGLEERATSLDSHLPAGETAEADAEDLDVAVAQRERPAPVVKPEPPTVTSEQVEPARATARSAHTRTLRVVASTANPSASDRQWAAVRKYREGHAEPANDERAHPATPQGTFARFKAFTTTRLAASIAAVVAVGALSALYAVELSGVDVYSTRIGEFHRVSLSDGSTVALNTDSEVRVRFTEGSRRVELVRGEALFEVAKNPERPFDVEAGDTTVRAVGTAFSVRLHDAGRNERVDVVVSEGRVAINPPSKKTYPAGSVATVRNGRVRATTVEIEDITGRLAWTTGRLVFQGEKLSEVVEEINRYNPRKLLVADPDIAGLRIGGTFNATDPDGFARALSRTFGIKSHLVSRPYGEDVIRLDSGVP